MLGSVGCCQRGVARAGRPVPYDMQLSKLESFVLVKIKLCVNSIRITHSVESCARVES
jgi:hypothetical protein